MKKLKANFFYPKIPKTQDELKQIMREKKLVNCINVHDDNCIIRAFKSSLTCSFRFKKVLMIYFLLKVFKKLKSFKNLHQLLRFYIRFFKKPMKFIFMITFLARIMLCYLKKFKILQTKFCLMLFCFGTGSNIYFESDKRAMDLSMYFFGPCLMSV